MKIEQTSIVIGSIINLLLAAIIVLAMLATGMKGAAIVVLEFTLLLIVIFGPLAYKQYKTAGKAQSKDETITHAMDELSEVDERVLDSGLETGEKRNNIVLSGPDILTFLGISPMSRGVHVTDTKQRYTAPGIDLPRNREHPCIDVYMKVRYTTPDPFTGTMVVPGEVTMTETITVPEIEEELDTEIVHVEDGLPLQLITIDALEPMEFQESDDIKLVERPVRVVHGDGTFSVNYKKERHIDADIGEVEFE